MSRVGLILGAGIYVLIGDVAGIAGNAMWISFIVTAFIATCYQNSTTLTLSSDVSQKRYHSMLFTSENAFGNNAGLRFSSSGWLIIFVAMVSAAASGHQVYSGYFSSLFPQFDPLLSALLSPF